MGMFLGRKAYIKEEVLTTGAASWGTGYLVKEWGFCSRRCSSKGLSKILWRGSLQWQNGLNVFSITSIAVVQLWSSVQLFATPQTVACQAPLSMGFSRQVYWSGLPFPSPGNFPNPRIKSMASHLLSWQEDYLPPSHLGSTPITLLTLTNSVLFSGDWLAPFILSLCSRHIFLQTKPISKFPDPGKGASQGRLGRCYPFNRLFSSCLGLS